MQQNEPNNHIQAAIDLVLEEKSRSEHAEKITALALMKLIKTFPWLVEVAEAGYDPVKAKETALTAIMGGEKQAYFVNSYYNSQTQKTEILGITLAEIVSCAGQGIYFWADNRLHCTAYHYLVRGRTKEEALRVYIDYVGGIDKVSLTEDCKELKI